MRIHYKYMSINGGKFEWFKRTLEGWIYFASPFAFNDPFELSPVFSVPTEQAVDKFLEKFDSSLTKSSRSKVVRGALLKLQTLSMPAVHKEWVASLGVLCLTPDPKNLLMWGHYGDSHKGVCLGFDGSYPPFSTAKAIKYSSERPSIPITESHLLDEAVTDSILLTKSPHWRYENEWRAIKRPVRDDEKNFYRHAIAIGEANEDDVADLLASEGGHGQYQFEPQALRRVIIGARMDSEKRAAISNMVASMPWVKLYQAELDRKYFVINLREVIPLTN